MARLAAPLEQQHSPRFNITRTTDARAALAGANFVITTFRVGDMAGRAIDERVALNHGALGQETTGPGGLAMGLRTIPVLFDYLDLMREACPEAWLINFANPAGMLAEAVVRHGRWPRAVGICDAPTSILRTLAALLGAPPAEVFLEYFGLNHLGWAKGVWHNGRDRLPELLARLARGEAACPPFEPGQVLALGMWPNEYLYYYYSDEAVPNLLRAGRTRGEQLLELNARLFADLERAYAAEDFERMQTLFDAYHRARGETYFVAETGQPHTTHEAMEAWADEGYAGVALNVLEALTGRAPQTLILNVPNRGAVGGMRGDDVVEAPCWVGRDLIRPLAIGAIPDHALGLMKQVKACERLTIEAALERSYAKALAAFSQHPLTPSHAAAKAILDEYIEKHGATFPPLA
jgi:6-phospho-beta-glucosidase